MMAAVSRVSQPAMASLHTAIANSHQLRPQIPETSWATPADDLGAKFIHVGLSQHILPQSSQVFFPVVYIPLLKDGHPGEKAEQVPCMLVNAEHMNLTGAPEVLGEVVLALPCGYSMT